MDKIRGPAAPAAQRLEYGCPNAAAPGFTNSEHAQS
jgi:hypothetical protein